MQVNVYKTSDYKNIGKELPYLDLGIKDLIKKVKYPYNPIWQDLLWNETLTKSLGQEYGIIITLCNSKNKIITSITLEKRKVFSFKNKFNIYGLFSIGGPIGDLSLDNLKILKSEIKKVLKSEKISFCQIEGFINNNSPLIPPFKKEDDENVDLLYKNCFDKIFNKEGEFKRFVYNRGVKLDLTKTKEELLSEMKQRTRYKVRLSEKKGIKSFKVDNNEDNLKSFYKLFNDTTSRNDFSGNNLNYFKVLLDYIYSNNLGGLYFAYKDEEIVAAGIFITYLDTCFYYYGASSNDNKLRRFMGTYGIQWKAIIDAKELGALYYDFGGVSKDLDDKSDSLAGVTSFKLGFSTETYLLPNSRIIINNNLIFQFLKILQFLKKTLRFGISYILKLFKRGD